jgi:hypothetical protein
VVLKDVVLDWCVEQCPLSIDPRAQHNSTPLEPLRDVMSFWLFEPKLGDSATSVIYKRQ